jgi:hypothetical protein
VHNLQRGVRYGYFVREEDTAKNGRFDRLRTLLVEEKARKQSILR